MCDGQDKNRHRHRHANRTTGDNITRHIQDPIQDQTPQLVVQWRTEKMTLLTRDMMAYTPASGTSVTEILSKPAREAACLWPGDKTKQDAMKGHEIGQGVGNR